MDTLCHPCVFVYDIPTETLIVPCAPFACVVCDRIIEIEWAISNNVEFKPSPKRPRKVRPRKAKAVRVKHDAEDEAIVETILHRGEDKENERVDAVHCKRPIKGDTEIPTTPKKRRLSGEM